MGGGGSNFQKCLNYKYSTSKRSDFDQGSAIVKYFSNSKNPEFDKCWDGQNWVSKFSVHWGRINVKGSGGRTENSSSLTSLPVDRLNGEQLQRQRSCQLSNSYIHLKMIALQKKTFCSAWTKLSTKVRFKHHPPTTPSIHPPSPSNYHKLLKGF